ncbi:hypothetical protein B0A79_05295 [Flavobacterium piscis]|uniref:DUF4476 domain-containing protein n=1 Tax=Flavobacterium piscis TaxID=1114874 RepID=A0ABX2XLG4_9FLAO|nr:hypothetical protein [Flavobacterium piscis]OCB76268.1 hypothetical protein FLP_06125 [Flavobacterium piscis]OXG06830.1 hypothetical protein B0A79_05295 [Flavobacterium piscis]
MKKKLEADLISIAHRILKIKKKSDINQLYLETQKLYEKLAILKFVDENFDTLKPTIGHSEISTEIESIFDKEETIPEEVKIEEPVAVEETPIETVAEPEATEEIKAEETEETEETVAEEIPAEEISGQEIVAEVPEEITTEPIIETVAEPVAEVVEEPVAEKTEEPIVETKEETQPAEELSFTTVSDLKPIPDFVPLFELEKPEEKEPEKEEPKAEISIPNPMTISFEDFGLNYADAQFVKVDSFENVASTPAPVVNEFKEKKEIIEPVVIEKPTEAKAVTLNEKLAKGFHIDLNDRIAFTKNLFGNSSEDYSRVLNQLLTFDNYNEAQEFIENMVKPDYNNWEGKDDYAERFLGIVEKKFS